ncbi:Differentially expressed in FDCP 6 [Amphibalanus amphitrite]|uniref:Differentially expressed in FDCP 6 n=1 Tax=Amphibalanus amphitrite TaxID=1232801 RepID=A0A6A4VGP3_AMPAM|nr:Differentially expressed in FDCP 6 [Amphibalanus amphitrite]
MTENSIWHAFNVLDTEQHGSVAKSKLKVLTQNLGTLLDLADQKVEIGLAEFRSTSTLTFEHYKFYLTHEVYSRLPEDLSPEQMRQYQAAVEDACWLLFRSAALKRDMPTLPEDCVHRLFRVFCCLGELMSDPDLAQQVVMNAGEVDYVASKFVQALGRVWDSADFKQLAEIIHHFKFAIFLAFLETRYAQDVEIEALREAVSEVYDLVVEDVLLSGQLHRRASCLRGYRPLWCVLTPRALRCFRRRGDARPCLELMFSPQTQVANLIEQAGVRPNRLSVTADGRTVQLAAPDYKTKFQWLSALETAVAFSAAPQGHQRHLAAARRADWHQTEAQQHEDDRRRLSQINIMDSTKAELEAERLARAAAEAQAAELEMQKAEEERKLAELEETRLELERLLQEEKQAKRDEELVRSAQSRHIREEWERREELERLQSELTVMLDEERQKREAFEVLQKTKERQLEEAQRHLREVEEGRVKLDQELKAARSKLIAAERSKGQVESKLRVRERDVALLATHGQTGLLPLRSASFRDPREFARLAPSSSFRAELNNNTRGPRRRRPHHSAPPGRPRGGGRDGRGGPL